MRSKIFTRAGNPEGDSRFPVLYHLLDFPPKYRVRRMSDNVYRSSGMPIICRVALPNGTLPDVIVPWNYT